VLKVLADAVMVLGGTVALAREIFRETEGGAGKSLIVSMVEGIEKGEPHQHTPTVTSPQTKTHASLAHDESGGDMVSPLPPSSSRSKDKTHHRRASRLASISLPFSLSPPSSPSALRTTSSSQGHGSSSSTIPTLSSQQLPPIMSTPALLRTLPSSPLLLRYLPQSVKFYTPYLFSSSSSSSSSSQSSNHLPLTLLVSTLQSWLSQSLTLLQTSLAAYASSIPTIALVWAGRARVRGVLDRIADGLEKGEMEALVEVLEKGWSKRVEEICEERLEEMAVKLREGVKARFELLEKGEKDAEGGLCSSPISQHRVPTNVFLCPS
jgi:hypothetical protein